ncbi:Mov34/MPN/PAD-1 family protein [Sphingomonas sp. ERG5]|uniref:Mov34/MPN/PAD-1 family protein n=1 Tax=Sphingomonas sp. ERG5 TaxID=1381597 RepID=UPI00054BEB8F|nr:Mov34/MPN/PAD-1 family protein [Sphingomonas sp. ERG5]
MGIAISSTLLRRLLNAACASPDAEICGLLFGSSERIEAAEAAINVAPDPARLFEIDPAALFAAHRAARAGGARMIGHYHSHPSGTPVPSARDAEAAMGDGAYWLILTPNEARLWRSVAIGAFEPVPLDHY